MGDKRQRGFHERHDPIHLKGHLPPCQEQQPDDCDTTRFEKQERLRMESRLLQSEQKSAPPPKDAHELPPLPAAPADIIAQLLKDKNM